MMKNSIQNSNSVMVKLLSNEQISKYQEEGYLVIRSLFSDEDVEDWQQECNRLLSLSDIINEYNWRTYIRKFKTGVGNLEKIDPVIDISPVFLNLSKDWRIISIVKQILQDEEIYLFRDKLILKPPGQGEYPLHQDHSWWNMYPPNDICTIVIAIDNSNKTNGAIEFFKGYHQKDLLSQESKNIISGKALENSKLADSEIVEIKGGDVIVFHSLTPHCSSRNMSTSSRKHFYCSYNTSKIKDVYALQITQKNQYLSRQVEEKEAEKMFFK